MTKFFTKKHWVDFFTGFFASQSTATKIPKLKPVSSPLKPWERVSLKVQERQQKANIAAIRKFIKFSRAQRGKLHDGWLQVELESEIHPRARYHWGKIFVGGIDESGVSRTPHEFANCWLSGGRLCFAAYDRRQDSDTVRFARAFAEQTGIPVRVGASNSRGRGSSHFSADKIFLDYPETIEDKQAA